MMNFLERILRMPRVVLTIMVAAARWRASAPTCRCPRRASRRSTSRISTSRSARPASRRATPSACWPSRSRIASRTSTGSRTTPRPRPPGHASVFLEFDVNADKDKALADIRAKLDGVAARTARRRDRADGDRDLVREHPVDLGGRLRRRAGARAGAAAPRTCRTRSRSIPTCRA